MESIRVGIFSSCGVIQDRDSFQRGLRILEERGFRVKLAPSTLARAGLFPSDEVTLAEEFMGLYLDEDVDVLLASRGGYGSSRLLPHLDFPAIAAHPKRVCGYSDMTALIAGMVEQSGIPALHGPMVCSLNDLQSPRSLDSLIRFLKGEGGGKGSDFFCDSYGGEGEILGKGEASGILKGGNLCVFTTLLGTDYEVDCRDSILFLEDVHEEPYRIHRMMNQLKMAGSLDKARGFILGRFSHCSQREGEDRFQPEIREIMEEFLLPLGKPALWNIPAGHIDDNMTMIFGREVSMKLSAERGSLIYL